jgi:hypothetical protein
MQNLIPLILIGFFIYLIFFRKGGMGGMGGMGCCGGHGGHGGHEDQGNHSGHSSDKEKKANSELVSQMQDDNVIDLQEGRDYVSLPAKDDSRRSK